ncbi:MAG: branched-chain amino acid aminotransferase [Deltaproteobacteria bacterium]|nr:branched-chain amino acid aminotransferase [Deltaproteobacteria bacterium]
MNRGLHYGDGLFETMRAYRGDVFRLDRHVERLLSGLVVLRISFRSDAAEIKALIDQLLLENGLHNAIIKIIVFRQGPPVPRPEPDMPASIIISAQPFNDPQAGGRQNGLSGCIVAGRRNSHSELSKLKSLNYLENTLARMEAHARGCDEAIFLNTEGMVAETTISNLFIVQGRKIMTPPVAAGILPGITRAAVLSLCSQQGYDVREILFTSEDLFKAEEVFMTNSVREIMPLVKVDGRAVGDGKPGAVTRRVLQLYGSMVADELEGGGSFED